MERTDWVCFSWYQWTNGMQKSSIVYFRSNKLKPRISKRIKSADVYGAQII